MEIDCSICCNDIITSCDEIIATKCGHVFHSFCVNNWFRSQDKNVVPCPECRSMINSWDLRKIYLNNTSNIDATNIPIVKDLMEAHEDLLKSQTKMESAVEHLKNEIQEWKSKYEALMAIDGKISKNSEPSSMHLPEFFKDPFFFD